MRKAKKVRARVADKASELNPLNIKPEEPVSLEDVPKITNDCWEGRDEILVDGQRVDGNRGDNWDYDESMVGEEFEFLPWGDEADAKFPDPKRKSFLKCHDIYSYPFI